MNKRNLLSMAVLLAATTGVAQKGPTMGWSSWNTYGVKINEDLIKSQADAMVDKGLKAVGYDHINIDDGFFGGRNKETGELIIHPTRFPNGLKPVADYIHSKGLKAGIYSDAGANTCGNYYNGDTQSVNVGFYNYDQHDADYYFKECGFDFIKVDFCGGDAPQNSQRLALDPQERYTAISNAIKNTGRTDVRLNVCRWDYPGTWVHDVAFSWRTTKDISNSWNSVKKILAENLYLSAYCYDGHYNDMDMLEVGRSLTDEEDRTHFGLWCIMSSPLLIGCDLTTIKDTTLKLLTNEELIALNQDTLCLQAYVAGIQNGCHILVKDLETLGGTKRAFAVYNPTDGARKAIVNFNQLDLGGTVSLRDVYERKDVGAFTGNYTVTVPAHGTRIYVAQAERRLERTRYEAETGYISDYQELVNNQSAKTGIYEASTSCSAGFKAGWLGYSEQNDLQWRDVYSTNGGDYHMTIAFICGEDRDMTVSVNGKEVKTIRVNSGGWNTVGTTTVDIALQKGRNTVRLSNATAWMPDIDYMELSDTAMIPVDVKKTDITSQYIKNSDFSKSEPIDNHVCGYGKDMAKNGTSYYGLQPVTDWKAVDAGATSDGYDHNGMGGAVFAYGSSWKLVGGGFTAPATSPDGKTGNALGLFSVWGQSAQYVEPVTLPAGSYELVYTIYNAGGTDAVPQKSWIGFIADSGEEYTAESRVYTAKAWSTETVKFTLSEETSGMVSLGYQSSGKGSSANPHLFFDNVKLISVEANGQTTALDKVQMKGSDKTAYYSLQGVRLNKPIGKGVYIHHGKKIVVK